MDLKAMEWIVDVLRRELESLQSEVKELNSKLNTKTGDKDPFLIHYPQAIRKLSL